MIRKVGKRWIYECRTCDVQDVQLDLLRVTEAMNRHQRTWSHIFQPAVISFREAAKLTRESFRLIK